jgi:hypothetical protein
MDRFLGFLGGERIDVTALPTGTMRARLAAATYRSGS